jgi:hypothetical protein
MASLRMNLPARPVTTRTTQSSRAPAVRVQVRYAREYYPHHTVADLDDCLPTYTSYSCLLDSLFSP